MREAADVHHDASMNTKIPGNTKAADSGLRVLLVGYNGANNTGAEARLLAVIEDVRAVLGPSVRITVPAIREKNLKRYVNEGPDVKIVHLPTIFWPTLRKQARNSDLVMLVEGSTYIDSYTSALLWCYLWATKCAKESGKACLAYAVDAGEMSARNRRNAIREANRTDLIITRSRGAAELLRSLGVNAPLETTADTAIAYSPRREDAAFLKRVWPEAERIVGFAMVDFHRLPIVMRPWGKPEDCYKWPFYYSTSPARKRASERLAANYAAECDRIIARHGRSVALICMDEMDAPIAEAVLACMTHGEKAKIFCSRDHSASEMTWALRGLDLLVASRYHACVLAMEAGIPMIAVGHDARLRELFRDMGLSDGLFLAHDREDLFQRVSGSVDRLLENSSKARKAVLDCHAAYARRARRNRDLLREFARARGWEVSG